MQVSLSAASAPGSVAVCSSSRGSRGSGNSSRRTAAPLPAGRRGHLQVAACHRCLLQRQRIPRPQQQQQCGSRGLGFAAAVKHGSAGEKQAAEKSASEAADNGAQQASAQPPAEQQQQQQGEEDRQDSVGVRAALGMLRFYKAAISPLLPPACRFLPTCSVYSMEAFQRYGVGKGFVLTSWRLLRCTPWGNSGYDPVRWPPPGLEMIFRE